MPESERREAAEDQPPEPFPPLWWTPAMRAAARAYGRTLYESAMGYGECVKLIFEAAGVPVPPDAALGAQEGEQPESGEREPYDGEMCDDCNQPVRDRVGSYWRAPDDLWAEIVGNDTTILCPRCFGLRADAQGVFIHWQAHREPSSEPGEREGEQAEGRTSLLDEPSAKPYPTPVEQVELGRGPKLNEAREYLRAEKERAIEAQDFEGATALREMEFAVRDGTARMLAVERENLQLRASPIPTPEASPERCRICRKLRDHPLHLAEHGHKFVAEASPPAPSEGEIDALIDAHWMHSRGLRDNLRKVLAARSGRAPSDEGLRAALRDCETLAKKALTEPLSDFAATNVGGICQTARAALATPQPPGGRCSTHHLGLRATNALRPASDGRSRRLLSAARQGTAFR